MPLDAGVLDGSHCTLLSRAGWDEDCKQLAPGGRGLAGHHWGHLDVGIALTRGVLVTGAVNHFAVAAQVLSSVDGLHYAQRAVAPPSVATTFAQPFAAPYVRLRWNATAQAEGRRTAWLLGHPAASEASLAAAAAAAASAGGEEAAVFSKATYEIQPEGCFDSLTHATCCTPLRPKCFSYNLQRAMGCCAVPLTQAMHSTCLSSNTLFPNSESSCGGRPLEFFWTFDAVGPQSLVGAMLDREGAVKDSLHQGCLLQSILYLFHQMYIFKFHTDLLGQFDWETIRYWISLLLHMVEACNLDTHSFFELTNTTPAQMLHLAWLATGMLFPQLLPRAAAHRQLVTNAKVFDVGAAAGLDAGLYLQMGARVVSVEASPVAANCTRSRLLRMFGRGGRRKHHVVNAKVALEAGFGARGGFAMLRGAHTFERSGDDAERREGARGEGGLEVLALPVVSCEGLVRDFGRPLYMKIDVEDATHDCLLSLEAMPSPYLPPLISAEGDEKVLESLWRLGYREFKIVRQSPHSTFRTRLKECFGFDGHFVESSSGLFGDFAVDIDFGENWRSYEDARPALALLNARPEIKLLLATTYPPSTREWFDVHGRHPSNAVFIRDDNG